MSSEIHPKYRPDIDGLRALAILIVVFFHAFPKILTGGFVGVDIFFVISGYLISTIIFKEKDKNSFSFRNFYARRVNRIFPAFILVMVSCLIFGWMFLFPEEIKKLGKHALNGTLFLLNINLFQENGYFETSSELKPLLHLWSLCVEEQYYLLWPIMVVAFWKRKNFRLPLLIASIVISFAANIYLTTYQPAVAFYFSAPRFWELLFGSFLAYMTIYHGGLIQPIYHRFNKITLHRWQNIFSVIGLTLIVLSVALLDDTKSFPGFWAVLPVTGATLLIATPWAWINKNIFANRVAVFIGLISYPLYLWHWPLLAFAKIWVGSILLSPLLAGSILAISFILATATFLLLEKPLRSVASSIKTKSLLCAWIILIGLSLVIYKQIIPSRLTYNSEIAPILAVKKDWHHPMQHNEDHPDDPQMFTLNPGAKNTVLLWGDSHVEQYWARMEKLTQKKGAPSVIFVTCGGCPPLPGTNRRTHGLPCDTLYKMAYDQALKPETKSVVIGAFWEKYFDKAYQMPGQIDIIDLSTKKTIKWNSAQTNLIFEALERDIRLFKSRGKKVYLLLSNPTATLFDPVNLVSRMGVIHTNAVVKQSDYITHTAEVRQKMIDLAKSSGAILIDPGAALCKNDICPTFRDNLPIYKDGDHLSDSFVREHADFMDRVLY